MNTKFNNKQVPNRPTISNVLIKASANVVFRNNLLADPARALEGMEISRHDFELLTGIHAATLREFALQLKARLLLTV